MAMIRNANRQQRSSQQGMAAIMVTMILTVVITVIVLGFSQVVQREQRNALDNQLSTQAYYAAESGVNLAQKKIQDKLSAGTGLVDKNDCGDSPDYNITAADFAIGEEAQITCLLINSRLSTLEYQKVDMHSVPMYVKSAVGAIDKIYISWQASGGSSDTTGCLAAPGALSDAWPCPQPLLRLDLVSPSLATNPTDAANNQYTAFLYPTTAGGTTTSNNLKDNVVPARCTVVTGALNPKVCTVAIAVPAAQAYAARVMSIYGASDVTVFATDNTDARKTLVEGQVLIDATAKASDVLKRVQARMSLATPVPDFAITAGGGGVCKRYQLIGTSVSIASGSPAVCDIP